MNEGKIKRAFFRVKWLSMSDKDRHAYLWKQTRENVYGHELYSRYGCMWRHAR